MSIQSFDAALTFLPDVEAAGPRTSLLDHLRILARCLGDANRAAGDYELLVGRGMSPERAARAVFEQHMQDR